MLPLSSSVQPRVAKVKACREKLELLQSLANFIMWFAASNIAAVGISFFVVVAGGGIESR